MTTKTKANLTSPYFSTAILNHKEIAFLIGGLNAYIGTEMDPLIAEMSNKLLQLYESATGVKYPSNPPIKQVQF